jgi:hypothetical protein
MANITTAHHWVAVLALAVFATRHTVMGGSDSSSAKPCIGVDASLNERFVYQNDVVLLGERSIETTRNMQTCRQVRVSEWLNDITGICNMINWKFCSFTDMSSCPKGKLYMHTPAEQKISTRR